MLESLLRADLTKICSLAAPINSQTISSQSNWDVLVFDALLHLILNIKTTQRGISFTLMSRYLFEKYARHLPIKTAINSF